MQLIKIIQDKIHTRYMAYSIDRYNKFMALHNSQNSCYNAEDHNCNGSCQGCCNCLFVQHYNGEVKEPTPFQMRCQEIKEVKSSIVWEKIKTSPEYQKVINKYKI